MAKIVVLGAGVMGLAAAYEALRLGHDVTVFEASPTSGGMAAHFDFDGLSIERYYHFVCKADEPTFTLMEELGIDGKMRWRPTSMGYFIGGKTFRWGDPFSLLTFPHLNAVEKIRYGWLAFLSTRRDRWEQLENLSARAWFERWCGREVYEKLWRRLLDLKFYEYADNVSARWIWTRIRRVGRSRRSLFQEELGYIEGGSQTLVDALVVAIKGAGGVIRLGEPCERVVVNDGRAVGVIANGARHDADAVISTVPTPLISQMVPDLPEASKQAYQLIENIGVVCVVVKLRKPVTPHFWLNIVDPEIAIPGIIEFSNLRPADGKTVVYAPYYMPVTTPLWERPDEVFLDEVMAAISKINPQVTRDDLIAHHVGRLRHAQPVCPPGFGAMIPPIQTPIAGLQIADTCFYYPEDRGVAESVRLGRGMARAAA